MKCTFFDDTHVITQQFTEMIEGYTGLHIRKQDLSLFWQKIEVRMKALKLASTEQYYQHLISHLDVGKTDFRQAHPEWQQLIQLLTTGESYFFRDQGQFQLVQQQLLPELIRNRLRDAAAHHTKPTLRIWSAGCSTGEEAYSLAILVHQLIPDLAEWNLFILGTDINADAIAKAKKGFYSSWSFRTLDNETQAKYFRAHRDEWKLDEQICKMVTFCTDNLVSDAFPEPHINLSNFDLIVCRNVFIYFTSEVIAAVLKKLSRALSQDGYLMTGHAELYSQTVEHFQTKIFPESFVYQRCDRTMEKKQLIATDHSKSATTQAANIAQTYAQSDSMIVPSKISPQLKQDALFEVEKCFCKGDYRNAIQIAQQAIAQNLHSFEFHHLIAQAHASLGENEQAKNYCEKAIAINALAISPYYLLAHIARDQDHLEQAKSLLKRIIYLDPTAITAYLELSSLYTQEGDRVRARKMQASALELMQKSALETSVS
ncbi:MAG: CheR family methyltransferase [Stenomitos frigidus ULC029]